MSYFIMRKSSNNLPEYYDGMGGWTTFRPFAYPYSKEEAYEVQKIVGGKVITGDAI